MSCSTSSPPSIRATTGRSPTRIVTVPAPVRAASQRAAMRVALPDSSASEPSGFQMRTSAQSSPEATTSTTPSVPSARRRASSRAQRIRDDSVDVAVCVPALHGGHGLTQGGPRSPARSVRPGCRHRPARCPGCGASTCAGRPRTAGCATISASSASSARSLASSVSPSICRAVARSRRPARGVPPRRRRPRASRARARAIRPRARRRGTSRPKICVGWRVSLAPEPAVGAAQRCAHVGQLERPDDPAPVVRVDDGRGFRVALGQLGVRGGRPSAS